jgi:hypothetical protein
MNPMKRFSTFTLLASSMALLAFNAPAQVAVTRVGVFDNVPALMTASSTSNVLSTGVSLAQGKGFAFVPSAVCTNASTANFIFAFDGTIDGTNWTTTMGGWKITNAFNGTTGIKPLNIIPATSLVGVQKIRLSTVENVHNASITITNIVWSIPN